VTTANGKVQPVARSPSEFMPINKPGSVAEVLAIDGHNLHALAKHVLKF
jgi:hypothetical protein